MTWIRIVRYAVVAALLVLLGAAQPAWATLPTPNQPVLVVQNSGSTDPYQNFIPELLTTEGLNGFQTAQLSDLTAAFLANYDMVVLPHLALTSAQATLFSNYVNAGGNLIGFRPDLQLANVFGVASLGSTLTEGWLQINTTTAYGSGLDGSVMKFHGTADLYSLSGATALATLYSNSSSPTASPAAASYTFGSGTAILFSFDLTQSIVLMRQGNPAWAGYPNNHDGYNTMRASQMFMDQGSGQFWNDLGNGALNDVPQADIQLRLFSNALVLSNSAKRPLPKFWYFPNQNRALMLYTMDEHAYNNDLTDAINETSAVQSFGGKSSIFLWYPYGLISNSQVNSWLSAGQAIGVHFDDTAEVDSSGVGGSAASWSGMQNVISSALSSFTTTYPSVPFPVTTRDHFLIWVSNNAAGTPDQTAQAELFQTAGIQFDTSFSAFPNRWGYMNGSGLPMKFLNTTSGTVIPVYEQSTQYEDDVQIALDNASAYSVDWDLPTAQSHYQQTLSNSLTKYNTVVTFLFHPDHWSDYSSYAQTALQYAQSNSIPMYTTAAWQQFWQGRVATTVSMPSFTSNTLTFTATGAPAGLTLLVPDASGSNSVVSTFTVDGAQQSFTVAAYQGVMYAGVVLTAGTHNIAVTYTGAGRISGQIAPSAAAAGATIQIQGSSITQTVSVAPDGTYVAGPFPAGNYTVTPSSAGYTFTPTSRPVTLGTADVIGVNFAGNLVGQSLFTTQTPATVNASDGVGVNYELGTVFQSSAAGQITAIRFWKASNETGTHTGRIWSSTGSLLASVAFSNETASGWQQQALGSPLSISADTTYVVSVNTGNTYYVATNSGLALQVVNGSLSSVVGNDGAYGSPATYPTNSYQNSNYFRDVVFVPGTVPVISATRGTPQSAAISTAFTTALQATVVSNGSPVSGATVTFTAPSSGPSGSFGGSATATTNSSGVATAPAFTANSTAGSYTVTASVSGATSAASFSLTNNPGLPASLTATGGTPQSAGISTAFGTALQATVKDTGSNPVSGVTVTFTAPGSGASGSFGGSLTATATTNSSGVATAPAFTANSTTGSYTVTASVSGVAATASFSLTNTTAPPASIAATAGTPQSAVISTAFSTALQATVLNSSGNPVSGVTVTFTAPSSGASGNFSGSVTATATTNSSGVATAPTFTANSTAASYTVTASVSGVATSAGFSLTNTTSSLNGQTLFTTQTPVLTGESDGTNVNYELGTVFQSSAAGQITAIRFWKDSKETGTHTGNIWSGTGTLLASVAFSNETTSGWQQQSLASSLSIAANTTYVVSVNTGSTYYVATNSGLASQIVSGNLSSVVGNNGVYGSPATFPTNSYLSSNYFRDVVFVPGTVPVISATGGTPQSATISAAFGTALQATVVSNGNPVSGATVTFTAPSSGASGAFGGSATATATTNSSGVAMAPAFTANSTTGSYTVTASVSGATSAASFSLTNNPGLPASVTATAGTPQSAATSTAFATAFQAMVKDASSNPVSGVTVTFTAPGSGASGSFSSLLTATATTNGSGVATAPTFTANSSTGTYTVTSSVSGVATAASFSLTNAATASIAIDVTTSTDRSTSSKTIVSSSLSTASTNELLLAFISTDGSSSGTNVTASSISGGSLTWTLVQRTNVQRGTAEIWRAFAAAKLSSVKITATLSASEPASMTVMSFTGVSTSGTNGSGAIGAVGTGNANPGAPTASLVTTQANSWVIGVGTDWDKATARTLGANQVMVHQYLATVGDAYWVQRVTTLVPAGSTVTVNDTAPTTDRYNLSICEILP